VTDVNHSQSAPKEKKRAIGSEGRSRTKEIGEKWVPLVHGGCTTIKAASSLESERVGSRQETSIVGGGGKKKRNCGLKVRCSNFSSETKR